MRDTDGRTAGSNGADGYPADPGERGPRTRVDLTKQRPAAPAAAPGNPAPPDRTPTRAAGPGHLPPPAGAGHPQQHPQPPVLGGWTTPRYVPPPYDDPAPPRRSGRSTVVLMVVALLVALGAGGSVYALLRGDGTGRSGGGSPSRISAAPPAPAPGTSAQSSAPASASPTSPSPTAGAVPAAYLGTWTTVIDNATGHNTRRLVVRQGRVGDTVLSLTADGGTYHCVFRAKLAEEPTADGPLKIGPSAVTSGEPASSCAPGAATELTLLPDGRLQRLSTGNGESLTYTKASP